MDRNQGLIEETPALVKACFERDGRPVGSAAVVGGAPQLMPVSIVAFVNPHKPLLLTDALGGEPDSWHAKGCGSGFRIRLCIV